MNLEEIEARCLSYLRQSKKPMVSLGTLIAHCTRATDCEGIDRVVLRDFLRNHAEVHYFEGLGSDSIVSAALLGEAGIDLGPRVIAKDRMPSLGELSAMLAEQVTVMAKSLEAARAVAVQAGDTARLTEIDVALDRARALSERMSNLYGASANRGGEV